MLDTIFADIDGDFILFNGKKHHVKTIATFAKHCNAIYLLRLNDEQIIHNHTTKGSPKKALMGVQVSPETDYDAAIKQFKLLRTRVRNIHQKVAIDPESQVASSSYSRQ